ncbi:transglutaminase-like domain-containing protein [Neorhodopirellula pilleata]|nr:transglutaminase-like domain-containing protein [Neorhodopirellula pilleata]
MMRIIMTNWRPAGRSRRIPQWIVGIPFLYGLMGCDLPDRHDIGVLRRPAAWEVDSDTSAELSSTAQLSSLSISAVNRSATSVSGDDVLPPPWEQWYLHYLDSPRVGPTVIGGVAMKSETSKDAVAGDEDRLKVTLSERMLTPLYPVLPARLLQKSLPAATRVDRAFCMTTKEQTFWHSADGQLQRVICSTRRGPLETTKTIAVANESASIEAMGPTGIVNKKLSFEGSLGGPLLVYQSLRGNPIGPNEVRTATVLLPAHDITAKLQLRGNPPVLAKRFKDDGIGLGLLNEAIGLITTGETHHRERCYWYDDEGVIQTTNIVGEPDFAFRCNQEQFERLGRPILDQSHCLGVKVSGKRIPTGQAFDKVSHLALDVECLHPNPPQSLVDGLVMRPAVRQYIQRLDEQRQRIVLAREVVSDDKLSDRYQTYQSPSTEVDLAATALIDFRSGAMQGVLATVASLRNLDKHELALEINRTVHSLLTYRSLGRGFQPASRIATSTTADSTEHAIMLIAMLRANGIPARMAMGLRFDPAIEKSVSEESPSEPQANLFGYHAWVIAEVDQRWISLDPTTGQTTTVDRIALEVTDLADGNPDPLIDRMLGQLRWYDFKVHKIIAAR